MSAAVRPPVVLPFGFSIALHAALAGLLALGMMLPKPEAPPQALQIEAVVMDQAVLAAAAALRAEDTRRARAEAENQRAREVAAEQALLREQQAIEARQQEQQRQAAEADARRKADQQAAADAKKKAAADAKRKADQQAATRLEAERQKSAQDARLRAEREADLKSRLAAEEARTAAQSSGLRNEYVAAIQAHVERRWFKPPGMREGMRCTVNVTQIPGGEVVGVRFGTCNGGDAVRQSIETAIRNASPLPSPPNPALFDRQVELLFTPEGR